METSWLESANDGATDFPLQNLPFGVFSTRSFEPRIGVAISDQVLDLRMCGEQGILRALNPALQRASIASTLNP